LCQIVYKVILGCAEQNSPEKVTLLKKGKVAEAGIKQNKS